MPRTRFLVVFVAVLIIALPIAATAQDITMSHPPKVLVIGREEVKPGKAAAHEKLEIAWTQGLVRAKYATPFLAVTSITGQNEVWFLTGYDSFAAWESDAKTMGETPMLSSISQQYAPQESEFLAGGRTVAAVYREDLSYKADVKLGEMRGFMVRTLHVRPGHESDYVELRKVVNAAREKANADVHQAVFQVAAGAAVGTYLVFTPFKSGAQMDEGPNQAMRDALGDEGRQKIADLQSKAIMSAEDTMFAFSPKMSNPAAGIVAADPAYWKPKLLTAKKEGPPVAMKAPMQPTPVAAKK